MKKDLVKTGLLFVMLLVIIYAIIMIALPFTGIKIGCIYGDFMYVSCIRDDAFLFGIFSVPVIIFTAKGYEWRSPIVSLIGCLGFLIFNIYVSFTTPQIELIRFTLFNALFFLILIIIEIIILRYSRKKDLK